MYKIIHPPTELGLGSGGLAGKTIDFSYKNYRFVYSKINPSFVGIQRTYQIFELDYTLVCDTKNKCCRPL
jgi:hypothetical protein